MLIINLGKNSLQRILAIVLGASETCKSDKPFGLKTHFLAYMRRGDLHNHLQ